VKDGLVVIQLEFLINIQVFNIHAKKTKSRIGFTLKKHFPFIDRLHTRSTALWSLVRTRQNYNAPKCEKMARNLNITHKKDYSLVFFTYISHSNCFF
jgi:hypothetical protein